MTGLWTLAALAVVLLLGLRLVRLRVAVDRRSTVTDRTLAERPATIHLIPAGARPWRRPREAGVLAEPLLDAGFEDAGSYTVDEMPGVVLRLLVRSSDGWLATVYEHPGVGRWLEISVRFQGGGGFAVTNLPTVVHGDRPDFPIRRLPGVPPATLLARMRAEQPGGVPERTTTDGAAERFERGYAEGVAWWKAHAAGEELKHAA